MERVKQIMEHPLYQYHQQRIEEAEKDRIFCRHGREHALDVARILYIQILENGLSVKKDVVYGTALLHDIGRWEQYEKQIPHHEAGAKIAGSILAECGYTEDEIILITDAILAHQVSDSEDGQAFNALLYKADKLSRACYKCEAKAECYWEDSKKNEFIYY